MSSEVNEMRFVLVDYFGGCDFLCTPPDEIHFSMDCTQCESCFQNQQNAAIKQESRASQAQSNGHDVIPWVTSEGNDPDGHAGCDEHTQAQIKRHHTSLQDSRTTGQLVELLKNKSLTFSVISAVDNLFSHFFEPV